MESLKNLLQQGVQRGLFPGCVAGVVWPSGQSEVICVGQTSHLPEAVQVNAHTVWDVASVTKSVVTGTLALMALQEQLITLETPVCKVLPAYQPSGTMATVKHLLNHTLDYRFSLAALRDLPPEQILQKLYTHNFQAAPGEVYCYCNSTSIVLGKLLEALYGKSLNLLAKHKIFDLLGMKQSGFAPAPT
jgi:CubicO group peptidase (beta-lactamase class C family)